MSDDIEPPRGEHPDRDIHCQEALEDRLRDVLDAALAAGWRREEIAVAAGELVGAWYLALVERDRTDEAIREAIEKLKRLS